jgi:hypothetical protein
MRSRYKPLCVSNIHDYSRLILGLILMVGLCSSNPKCVVDQCKKCRYANMDQCDECESGYYLKEWFGEDINRPYNACWSILKMILRWILGLLLLLSYCFCCYWAWRKGRNITRLETKKADKKTIIDNTK